MRRRHPALARFLAQPAAAVSLGFLIAEVVLVLILPLVLGQDPNVTDRAAGFWAAPGGAHLLGTDDVGRDLFARLLAGGRVSLLVGYAAAAVSTVLGVPLGLLADDGYALDGALDACDAFVFCGGNRRQNTACREKRSFSDSLS